MGLIEKMKILLLNNRYPSQAKPHVATYVQSMQKCIENSGAEVDLLVSKRNWNGAVGKSVDLLLYFFKVLFFRDYKQYNYLYINHFNLFYFALLLRFIPKEKMIFHWHGSELFSGSFFWKRFNKIVLKAVPADAIHIAPSNYFKNEIENRWKKTEVLVSPSGGVNTDVFTLKPSTATNEVVVGYASHVNFEKGFDLFLDLVAFSNTIQSNIRFKFIEYGNQLDKFRPKWQKFSNVEALKPFAKEKMIDFYHSIDVLLLPTRRKAESLGLVSIEAMSCNVPVIGTNAFAVNEYVQSGRSGEVFEFGNSQSLKKAFELFLSRKEDYKPRELVIEKYSEQSVVNFYKNLLF